MGKGVINIMCIYWEGDFRGRDFSVDDVLRLEATVDKYMDRYYNFYCLTNTTKEFPDHIMKLPLKHPEWPGWWAKVELHRPDLPKGRTLYLDLDTHVIRNLAPILDFPGNLVMFNTPHTNSPSQDKIVRRYQAATMLFDPGTTSWIYDKFKENPEHWMDMYRSEQDIMGAWIPDQPTFPDDWMVKLGSLLKDPHKNTKNTIIITGQPRSTSFRNPEGLPWLEKLAR